MPKFTYVCIDDDGIEVKGAAAAESEDQLAMILRQQGQHLVRTAVAGEGSGGLANIRLLEGVNRRDVIFFTNQLSTVMATGVGLVEGLEDIEAQTKKAGMRRVIGGLRLRHGRVQGAITVG